MAGKTDAPAIPPEMAAALEKVDAAGGAKGKVLRQARAGGGFTEYQQEGGKVQRREVDLATDPAGAFDSRPAAVRADHQDGTAGFRATAGSRYNRGAPEPAPIRSAE